MTDDAVIAEGYRRAREVTRVHARSFYFASMALFGQRKRSAYALYAFCRRLDDLVDGDVAGTPADAAERLLQAREIVHGLYGSGTPLRVSRDLPWHPSELDALKDTIQRYGIEEQPFQELINGMEMDLRKNRYANAEELDLYCYRVAGVVGLMMSPLLGYSSRQALTFAADLGHAMQLTNILRDVKEDLQRGRIYLPADQLTAFGVTEEDIREGRITDGWREFMNVQIQWARELYRRGALGVPFLTGPGSQLLVRLMSTLYGNILNQIEAKNYDVFSERAHVTFGQKLRLAVGVLFTFNSQRLLPEHTVSEGVER